jgi:hypothetical protein
MWWCGVEISSHHRSQLLHCISWGFWTVKGVAAVIRV